MATDEASELLDELLMAEEEIARLHDIIDSKQAEIDSLKALSA